MNNASTVCQKAAFEGPIPVGRYYIDRADLSDPGMLGDLARNYRPDSPGDWGDFRVKLHPIGITNTYGRNGFFIHGGSIEGSAGCIDVGGGLSGSRETNLLKLAISAAVGHIDVEVQL